MISQIVKQSDVAVFVRELIAEGTSFHPDDDFTHYVNNESGKSAYTAKEANLRNKLMEECFSVCAENNVDIYDFMLEISLKETGMDKFIPLPSEIN